MACRLKQGNLNSWPVGLERSTGGAPHFPASQGRKHAHNRYGEEYSYTGHTSSTFVATLRPRHLTLPRPSLVGQRAWAYARDAIGLHSVSVGRASAWQG